jgi:hypothetical protein
MLFSFERGINPDIVGLMLSRDRSKVRDTKKRRLTSASKRRNTMNILAKLPREPLSRCQ